MLQSTTNTPRGAKRRRSTSPDRGSSPAAAPAQTTPSRRLSQSSLPPSSPEFFEDTEDSFDERDAVRDVYDDDDDGEDLFDDNNLQV